MSSPAGTTLSHYQILGELGSGGMGVIYLARDLRLERTVAIKFLTDELAQDTVAKNRFLREARAISRLDHPNICSIYEIDETADGRVYIVMCYYEGSTLDRRMASGPLSFGEALGITTQVAHGLANAHAAGIVHRDVKPTNIILTSNGVIKILDFGLAKVPDMSSLTTSGQIVGTPAFMAPEQYRGEVARPAADVWSTGVLLYFLLTGRVPFRGENPVATMYAVLNRDPEPLTTVAQNVPVELDGLVRRCLEKDPLRRYANAGDLAAALRRLLRQFYVDQGAIDLHTIPDVARTALGTHPSRYSLGPWRRIAAFASIPIIALGVWLAGNRIVADRREPLRVAVPFPEVKTVADSSEVELASSTIQSALLRGLAGFKGIAVLDPSELRRVTGTPAEIAAAVSADEVVTGSVEASGDEWRVRLRWTTRRNTVRWTDEFSVPRDDPLILANALIARLARAYPRLGYRSGVRLIRVGPEDYTAFLALYRSTLYPTPVRLDEKLKAFDALHRAAPSFLDAYLLDALSSAYAYQVSRDPGHLERARRAAAQARSLAPDDPRVAALATRVALLAGKFDESAQRLEELDRLDPGNIETGFYRALLAEKTGRVGEALAGLTRVAKRRPSYKYLTQLADMEYRNGRIDLARGSLAGLIRRFPDDPFAYSKLAQLELLYGSTERADSIYSEILKRTPTSSPELNNRGLARMLLRRYPAALVDFRNAFAQNPKKAVYLLNVADCEGLAGRIDSATVHYAQVLELGRSDPSASSLMWRAQCLAHLGRKQEAVATAQEGVPAPARRL